MFVSHNNFYRLCMGRFTAPHQCYHKSSETALVCKWAVTQGSVCMQGYFQETTLAYRSDCGASCRMMMRKPTHNPAAAHLLNVTSALLYIILTIPLLSLPHLPSLQTPPSHCMIHSFWVSRAFLWGWGFPFILKSTVPYHQAGKSWIQCGRKAPMKNKTYHLNFFCMEMCNDKKRN